ncbi:MAG TPA: hypothetical protein PKY53_05825 [Clostridia bacterium]|nr:hypothetical protein [Clostridia bacterium]
MPKNPFIILGVGENCTQDELYDAYRSLRNEYADLRFEEGQVGADACARLEEIENAYREASEIVRERYNIKYTGSNLADAENAIKSGNMDEAQNILDNCQERTAQWHYLQSVIFYKKNWLSDALRQLEFACNLEPGNEKYEDAKAKLMNKMNEGRHSSFYRKENINNNSNQETGRSYARESGNYQPRGVSACDCCSSLICADCCCECMGGDLISCC